MSVSPYVLVRLLRILMRASENPPVATALMLAATYLSYSQRRSVKPDRHVSEPGQEDASASPSMPRSMSALQSNASEADACAHDAVSPSGQSVDSINHEGPIEERSRGIGPLP